MIGRGFVSLTGQTAQLAAFAQSMKMHTFDELENALEKSALEVQAKMKEGIAHGRLGLEPNTELTQKLKNGNIPLVDSTQLVNNITVSELKQKGDSEFFFVGVKRSAPQHRPSSSSLGRPGPVKMFDLARRQVEGYTTTLPRTGIKKEVPARDFRTPVIEAHDERHLEIMMEGVDTALSAVGT